MSHLGLIVVVFLDRLGEGYISLLLSSFLGFDPGWEDTGDMVKW